MNTQKFTFWKFRLFFFGRLSPHLVAVANHCLRSLWQPLPILWPGMFRTASRQNRDEAGHRARPQIGQVYKPAIMFGVWHEACELMLWIWGGTAHLSVVVSLCPDAHSRKGFA